MKVIWLLVLLLLTPAVSAVGADFYVMEVSPSKFFPGEIATINITLKNLGVEFASYLRATIDPSDLSPVNALDSPKKFLSKAEAAETSNEFFGIVQQRDELILQYQIKVDDTAKVGAYQVPLALVWEDSLRVEKNQTLYVGINIEGQPNIIISKINSTPDRIYPDKDFKLTITLENIGTGKAKAVESKLSIPKEFSGEQTGFVGTIERDKTATVAYNLKAFKEAENKAYDFKLVVLYTDEKGSQMQVERPFQIFVSTMGDVDLEIAGISTSPAKIYPGTDFTLSVQLENIGTQDAKSVRATISDSAGFVGEFASFIGKIEADDVSSGIFDLTASKTVVPGDHQFKLDIFFTDEKGSEFSETKVFSVFVDEPPKSPPYYTFIPIFVILLVVVVVLRRRKAAEV